MRTRPPLWLLLVAALGLAHSADGARARLLAFGAPTVVHRPNQRLEIAVPLRNVSSGALSGVVLATAKIGRLLPQSPTLPGPVPEISQGEAQTVPLVFSAASLVVGRRYSLAVQALVPMERRPARVKGKLRFVMPAVTPDPVGDEPETPSPGALAPLNVSETAFNPLDSDLQLGFTGASLAVDKSRVTLTVNDRAVPASGYTLLPGGITIPQALGRERNEVSVVAPDTEDRRVDRQFVFWCGEYALDVRTMDGQGRPVDGVAVRAELGDDPRVQITSSSLDGMLRVENVPDRTIVLHAQGLGNTLNVVPVTGSAGSVDIAMIGFNPASPVDNNDFSGGLSGWVFDPGTPVTLVPHQESGSAPARIRGGAPDMDLQLTTAGEGPVSVSRTFVTRPGTRRISVRYRFITSEVPGGYFGSQFNDYFAVCIRALNAGSAISDGSSMNALGLGAFDAGGATDWREASLPLETQGDVVQVDILVANVGDGLFDSSVQVDLVEESPVAITQLSLHDLDGTELTHLSVGGHPYFGSNTRVHGTIRITGPVDDAVTSVVLEVLEGASVRAQGSLAAGAQSQLVRPFGPGGSVSIAASTLLFELNSSQSANLDTNSDGLVGLRVRVRTQNGGEAELQRYSVQKLVFYPLANRYAPFGAADRPDGDDWVRPSVMFRVAAAGAGAHGLACGDFSNMNGGPFPPHGSHRTGLDVDCKLPNYANRDAAAAAALIALLDDLGDRVQFCFVDYAPVAGNAFFDAINGAFLADGRRATTVIRPDGSHRTHFHLRFYPAGGGGTQSLAARRARR